MTRRLVPGFLLLAPLLVLAPLPSLAQQLDFSRGGPIGITASDGIEWRQVEQQVIARGNARAVREGVTITADRLVAWYRKKGGEAAAGQGGAPSSGPNGIPSGASGSPPAAGISGSADTGGTEIYRVQAEGNVHIFTQTDQAQGDRATYDLDQAVLVLTGRNLRLTTPSDVITARDSLEYWAQKHMAVARGNAVVVTQDARRLAADTLVAYTTDSQPTGQPAQGARPATPASSGSASPDSSALASSGKLERVEAFGNVSVRTPTDTVTGDRGVYVPDTGIARLGGHVRITRGQNQLNGSEADVNMKTGVARLLAGSSNRVQGLVVPNDDTNRQLGTDDKAAAPAGGRR